MKSMEPKRKDEVMNSYQVAVTDTLDKIDKTKYRGPAPKQKPRPQTAIRKESGVISDIHSDHGR